MVQLVQFECSASTTIYGGMTTDCENCRKRIYAEETHYMPVFIEGHQSWIPGEDEHAHCRVCSACRPLLEQKWILRHLTL